MASQRIDPLSVGWIWLAVVLGIGLLLFAYNYLAALAAGFSYPPVKVLINELSAAFGAGVLFWGVRALSLRRPLVAGRWLRRLPLYTLALVLYSTLHTSSNWGLRTLLYPLTGQGGYDYGRMPLRYFMEFPIDLISFVIMVAAVHWAAHRRYERERDLRAAHLERSLTESRLANLRLQLQPHFLFNALNTISATMYRNVGEADALIERLGELLRGSLSNSRDDFVPLGQELEWLAAYVAILEARFEDRLTVHLDIDDAARSALVPAMALQPLVENAVRHGGIESTGRGTIDLRARRLDGMIELSVADDGPGTSKPLDPWTAGFGLRSVAERLELLFGSDQQLSIESAPGAGFRVELRFPFRQRSD